MKLGILFVSMFFVSVLFGQTNGRGVYDIDGNRYKTILIGKKEWMASNLNVTRFNNGDTIAAFIQDTLWEALSSAAYVDLPNQSRKAMSGKLYNWYVVGDKRNVCPINWHVPTDNEWANMLNLLGGSSFAGENLKKQRLIFPFFRDKRFIKSNFNAILTGYIGFDGHFCEFGEMGAWWSSTQNVSNTAWNRSIHVDNANVYRDDEIKQSGLSLRCVRN